MRAKLVEFYLPVGILGLLSLAWWAATNDPWRALFVGLLMGFAYGLGYSQARR